MVAVRARRQTASADRAKRRRSAATALCLGFGLLLAACSSVPDEVNPVSWYQGVRDWVSSGGEPAPAASRAESATVSQPRQELLDAPYPNLASVPERPRPTMDPGATDRAFQELEAERAEAQRLDRQVRRDGPIPPDPETALRPESPLPGIAAPDDRTRDVYRRQLEASATGRPAPPEPPPYPSGRPVEAPPPPAVVPPPSPAVPAAPAAARRSTLIATVGFADGSAVVDAAGRQVLEQVADAQRTRPGSTLQLVGHASSKTRDMALAEHQLANFETSLKRANAVMVALLGLGVPQQAMQVSARADHDPAYYEVMPAGEAQNRRVEIYIVY